MSSPPREGNALSQSPSSSGSPHETNEWLPRHSPTLARSFDPTDPQALERQRTMDVDMAMQLSRARRETVTMPVSPVVSSSPEQLYASISALSENERRDLDVARGSVKEGDGANEVMDGARDDDETLHPGLHRQSSFLSQQHLHQTQDPSLLVSLNNDVQAGEDPAASTYGLPTYQANAPPSAFDFGLMEEFATKEKTDLGISSPTARFNLDSLRTDRGDASAPALGEGSSSPQSILKSARQRRLSQSTPAPRTHRKGVGGKMALFENNNDHSFLPGRLSVMLGGQGPSSSSGSIEHVAGAAIAGAMSSAPGLPSGILSTGHDRPYRFSFYSNAHSATIHARSLSELPAENQSFEDLFAGVGSRQPSVPQPHPPGNGAKERPISSTSTLPADAKRAFVANSQRLGGDPRRPGMSTNDDYDGHTWWLDINSPTDEEMKMLSKVFGIHPLTTEDIQMEETREKIELFRNYYFVCFRSFDQDQYSPTHLEPLNMYIIVFREGILSFHFRPTPHPQNVRRRIKQLKDYINVTSDWISYALIDDITDAFGPLIQSIEYEVDSIDELVLILKEAEQTDMLRRIGTCRKKVMGLLRLMGNKADVVKGLAKRCNENWRVAPTSDIGLYLSDIQDHLITMTQSLNHYEKILSRSHSNYLAQISIEMTDANNQINDVLSKLTALGTVLIPMNLVTGLWGMNVHVPGEGVENYRWFGSIIACLAAFAFIGGYSTYRFMVRK
ncbi:CorA metal ion transporter (MIT) family protein [Pleurotus pulmonarius]